MPLPKLLEIWVAHDIMIVIRDEDGALVGIRQSRYPDAKGCHLISMLESYTIGAQGVAGGFADNGAHAALLRRAIKALSANRKAMEAEIAYHGATGD